MREERLEVYTPEGQPTGILKARSDVHAEGLWHKTVQLWVRNTRGDVLLQKRATKKEGSPGLWDVSCGGHCVEGETPEISALRELEEELGLHAPVSMLQKIGSATYTSQQGRNNEWVDVFLLDLATDDVVLRLQEAEVSETCWLSPHALHQRVRAGDPSLASRTLAFDCLFRIANVMTET